MRRTVRTRQPATLAYPWLGGCGLSGADQVIVHLVLDKLPGKHEIRAIDLDRELHGDDG